MPRQSSLPEWLQVLPQSILAVFGVSTIAGLMVLVAMVCASLVMINLVYNTPDRREAWDAFLSERIPDDQTRDLCDRALVPPEIADCAEPDIALQNRHVPGIFKANLEENSHRDEVDSLFGAYQFACYEAASQRYRCGYQVGTYQLALEFDEQTDRITLWLLESPN